MGRKKDDSKLDDESETISVSKIVLSKTKLSLKVGDSFILKATVSPSDATDKTLTWKSSNDSVATVDSKGKVTAKGPGTAKITVTAGGKTATCTVTVTKTITYSVEWVKVEESSIGQYKLYIKSSEGKYVAGKVLVTAIDDSSEIVDIPVTGKMYIKSAIKSATVKSIN